MQKPFRRWIEIGLLAAAQLLASGVAAPAQQRPLPRVQAVPTAPQNRPTALPPGWMEQLQELTPAEQERFLLNNARFRRLSPQQKTVIRRRLLAWNNLSDEQREALLERQQIWEQMPLEQRHRVRESLLPQWQRLPFQSRQRVLGKLRQLRGLDQLERDAKLRDEQFLKDINTRDRQLLRELSSLLISDSDD
jgi:hypothetical protein